MKLKRIIPVLFLSLIAVATPVSAQEVRRGEVIVEIKAGASIDAVNDRIGTTTLRRIYGTNFYRLRTPKGKKENKFRKRLARKASAATKARARHAICIRQLMRDEREIARVIGDQVPGVRGELVRHAFDEPRRPVETYRGRAPKADAHQAVETAEVVHVGVRHEDVGHAQDLPRRQRCEIAKVEEQRPTLEPQIDV